MKDNGERSRGSAVRREQETNGDGSGGKRRELTEADMGRASGGGSEGS